MKGRACLALNASYEPLTVTPLRRAVRLVLEGKAEIVEPDGEDIRTGSLSIPRPAVIRLKAFVHVPRKFRRQVTNVFLFSRDRRTCQYCGRHEHQLRPREFLTRDHVIPISRGGLNTWENCTTACSPCNTRKGSRTPLEAQMPLLSIPVEPHLVHLVWAVRRLTALQRRYVVQFFGQEIAALLEE